MLGKCFNQGVLELIILEEVALYCEIAIAREVVAVVLCSREILDFCSKHCVSFPKFCVFAEGKASTSHAVTLNPNMKILKNSRVSTVKPLSRALVLIDGFQFR